MIARTAIMPQILFIGRRGQHDRVSHIAILGGPRRHRGVGWTGMSAEIIRRVPRSDGSHQQTFQDRVSVSSDTCRSVPRHCEAQTPWAWPNTLYWRKPIR
jgi:hypothetical protein